MGPEPSGACCLVLVAAAAAAACFQLSAASTATAAAVERRGPRFVVEPPSRIRFLNDTGASIPCQANGSAPVRLWWAHQDGSPVAEVSGLRELRANGDLVLLPFGAAALRPDVHGTAYRCMASNAVGTVRSRDCVVRAVVPQPYTAQVYAEYALVGNTGHLRCQIPAFVRSLVRVTAWLRAETVVATHHQEPGARFVLLNNGDLLIRNASRADSGYYRCQTRHELSHQTVLSQGQGRFVVNEVLSSVSPRIASQSPVRVTRGQTAQLVCVVQAWPVATVRWFQASESGLITPVRWSGNVQQHDGFLQIRHADLQHAGNWICMANNSVGEERAYIELAVRRAEPADATVVPERVRADLGTSASFLCNASVSAAGSILWLKDGQPVATDGRVRLPEPHLLSIRTVMRQDAGCYQCVVYATGDDDDGDEAAGEAATAITQATGELELGESPPQLLDTFPAGLVVAPGEPISLRCAATSSGQLPQIRWLLDERSLDGYAQRRFSMADFVRAPGQVVSFVNVTGAKVVDGGEYQCQASNGAGTVSYSARVNVMGPATLRADYSVTVVAGRTAVLRCPVIAYPVEWLQWQHQGVPLPSSHRHQVEPVVAGVGGRLTILNVHRDHDQGEYSCTVKGSDGKPVRGSVHMEVRVAPLIDGQLIAPWTVANEGMKVKLMCSVLEGDPPLRIQWFRGRPPEPVVTAADQGITVQQEEDYALLTFRSVALRHMANWTCRAWNDVLSVNRTTFLQVNVAPSWRAEPQNAAEVVLGHALVLHCGADGHPTPRILWKKSGVASAGANAGDEEATSAGEYRELVSTYRRQLHPNGTLSVPEADKSDAGAYMCQASNGIGAGLSKVVQVTVHAPPFFATKFLSQSVNKGESALLQCQAEGDPVLHVHWHRDRQRLDPANHTRYAIKQDLVSPHKVISFLHIDPVLRHDSTIYTCVASNAFGADNTSVQLIVQETPDPPQNVEVVEVSSRAVQLQWKSPYSGNSPLTRFLVQYRALNCSYMPVPAAAADWSELATGSGTELRVTVKGLLPDCHYQMKLSSENQVGRSQTAAGPVTVKTMEEVPGGPPTDVQVETSSSTSLKIRWRPPVAQVQFGRIRGYYIGYRVAGSDEPFQYRNVDAATTPGDEPQLSYLTNLRRKTGYVVILQAYNSVGAGPRSDEITVATFDSQPPTSPVLEVVSTSHEAIVLRWEHGPVVAEPDANGDTSHYVLYYQRVADNTKTEWHQKRVVAAAVADRQFVLTRDNTQGRIRCGTRYRLYMTATNSLGTGEPSETVLARTKGDTPVAPERGQFLSAGNGSSVQLALRAWQPRGCPILAFTIQYKPVQQKQWIPVVEYYEPRRDYFYMSHLNPNRDYQVLVTAHSDPGVTRQEYAFRTPNSSTASVVRLTASAVDPSYRLPPPEAGAPHQSPSGGPGGGPGASVHLRNLTVLLPVFISLVVLMVILGTLFGCLRRQHVNHVVNSVQQQQQQQQLSGGGGLCPEHLVAAAAAARYCNGKTSGTLLMPGHSECFAMAELAKLAPGEHRTLGHGSSPARHRINGQFATLACAKQQPSGEPTSYYSSPQRQLAAAAGNGIGPRSADHEYAEPVTGRRRAINLDDNDDGDNPFL